MATITRNFLFRQMNFAPGREVIRFEGDSHQLQEMKMEMYYVKGRFDIAIGEYETGLANIKASEAIAET